MRVAIELCCRAACTWHSRCSLTTQLDRDTHSDLLPWGFIFLWFPAVSTESHGKSSEWVYFTCDRRVRTPNSNFIEPSLFGTIWLLKDRKVNGEAKKILNFFYRSLWKSTFFQKCWNNIKITKILKTPKSSKFAPHRDFFEYSGSITKNRPLFGELANNGAQWNSGLETGLVATFFQIF